MAAVAFELWKPCLLPQAGVQLSQVGRIQVRLSDAWLQTDTLVLLSDILAMLTDMACHQILLRQVTCDMRLQHPLVDRCCSLGLSLQQVGYASTCFT